MPSRTKLDKSDEMIAERRQGTGKMPSDMDYNAFNDCNGL